MKNSCENHTGKNCPNCKKSVGEIAEPLDAKLRRFMFLSMSLHFMEQDIDIDEAGLELEQFERLDELLAAFVDKLNVGKMKAELVTLIHELCPMSDASAPEDDEYERQLTLDDMEV